MIGASAIRLTQSKALNANGPNSISSSVSVAIDCGVIPVIRVRSSGFSASIRGADEAVRAAATADHIGPEATVDAIVASSAVSASRSRSARATEIGRRACVS